jgi:hypothetical protein
MKVIVIIPTFGRKQLLNRVLDHLDGQTRAPDEVIVSAPDETHVSPFKAKKFPISTCLADRDRALNAIRHWIGRSTDLTLLLSSTTTSFPPTNIWIG